MELLRKQLENEFLKNGNSKKAIILSQRLDILVSKEQRKILDDIKLYQNN